jgi:Zn-dependent M28 family amino/carboxypeptidase
MFSNESIRFHLRGHVERLAGEIGPRFLENPESIQATTQYIQRQWESIGCEVARECFDALGQPACNLVVELKGIKRPEEYVLLGAHYDTIPQTPGADDNASAVAVLLEATRLLQPKAHGRTIRLIAFACEEAPYFNLNSMGSQHHAQGCRKRGDHIVGMLCLEMVGYYRDEPRSQRVPITIPRFLHGFFPKRGNFLAAVGNLKSWRLCWRFRRGFKKAVRFPLFSIVLPESVSEIRLSDHRGFWDQGYPALMLTDTSFLRNSHYHQASDTPDTLDYARMADVTLGVAGAIERLAR